MSLILVYMSKPKGRLPSAVFYATVSPTQGCNITYS